MKNEKESGSKSNSQSKKGSENEKNDRSKPNPDGKKKTEPAPKGTNPDDYKNMPGNQT